MDFQKVWVVSAFIISLLVSSTKSSRKTTKLLVASFDGFRYDYFNKTKTPNILKMMQTGATAPYLTPVFPSQTFTCHYAMATGLHAESHGIVANKFYDPEFNELFSKSNHETRFWDGGEPIWVTAIKNGLKSGTYFWPGTEVKIRGHYPSFWLKFNLSKPIKPRIDTVIEWLTEKDVDIATLYYHEPDKEGHMYGPNARQVTDAVKKIDESIGYLNEKIKSVGLEGRINVILTGDHGMSEVGENNYIYLSEILDSNLVKHTNKVQCSTICHIWPKQNKTDEVLSILRKNAHVKNKEIQVFTKETIPDKYHYKHNRRIPSILLEAKEGWIIRWKKSKRKDRGAHGYNPEIMTMKPFFVAYGPDFKSGYKSDPFNLVDLYPLMCKLLRIKPAPNNGTDTVTKHLLKRKISIEINMASRNSYHCAASQLIILPFVLVFSIDRPFM